MPRATISVNPQTRDELNRRANEKRDRVGRHVSIQEIINDLLQKSEQKVADSNPGSPFL